MSKPIIWYDFQNVDGSTVHNSGPQDYDATLHNDAKIDSSSSSPTGGEALSLYNRPVNSSSNDNGQYMSIPPFQLGGTITVTFWFKKNVKDEVGARLFDFFNYGQTGSTDSEFLAVFDKTGQLVVGYNDGAVVKILLKSDYCDDKWYHIAIVHDGKTMTVYINNKKIDSVAGSPISTVSRNYNYIGRGSQTTSNYSTMNIDDFRIYDTNLSEKDLKDIFDHKKDKSKKDTKNDKKKASGAAKPTKTQSVKEIFNTNYKKHKVTTILVTCIISIVVIVIFVLIGYFIKKNYFSS